MLNLYFQFVKFLGGANNIRYLPKWKGYELLDNGDWITLILVEDHWNQQAEAWEYDNLPLGNELEKFYNQCFIEVGKYSQPLNGQKIRHELIACLDRDNHDGFAFEVVGLGNFMIISHDGSIQLCMQTNQHRIAITREALALLADVSY